jgi:hypothetical protein
MDVSGYARFRDAGQPFNNYATGNSAVVAKCLQFDRLVLIALQTSWSIIALAQANCE